MPRDLGDGAALGPGVLGWCGGAGRVADVTGPLAQQFAQLWKVLEKHRRNEELLDGRDFDEAEHAANHAALSAIERHVQDMEKALVQITQVRLDGRRELAGAQMGPDRERREQHPAGNEGRRSPLMPGLRDILEAATSGEWWVDADEEKLDVRAVRDALERLREERDRLASSGGAYMERALAAEAEVRRLTEGLRYLDELAQAWIAADTYDGLGHVERRRVAHVRAKMVGDKARALLSANPPQGDAAEGSSPPTMPCGHPESSVVSADEGTAYCGECASPSDGGGA